MHAFCRYPENIVGNDRRMRHLLRVRAIVVHIAALAIASVTGVQLS